MIDHRIARHKSVRNSNIEMVRLIAMVMIVLNHSPWNAFSYADASAGYIQRLGMTCIISFLSNWGGVGDCLFFIISAWFLCDEEQSYERNISRCWHLEKQLWFWSLSLFIGCLIVWHMRGEMPEMKTLASLGLKTMFPFAAKLWWYPTSYMLFLMACPLLTRGLRLLTRERHAALCVGLLLIFGWTPASVFPLDMSYSIVLFFYLYVLVCFVKWHMPFLYKSRSLAYVLLAFGLTVGLGSQLIIECVLPNRIVWTMWMNSPRCLSTICIALAIVVMATTAKPRYSRVINYVAASTLAVYLVCTHMFANLILRPMVSPLHPDIASVGKIVAMAAIIYIVSLIIDILRHWIFSWTIDRNINQQNDWIIDSLRRLYDRGVRVVGKFMNTPSGYNPGK